MKSIISSNFINKHNLWHLVRQSNIQLSGVNGKNIPNLGSIILPLSFPNSKFKCEMDFFIVSAPKPLIILGTDFCNQFKCDILFSKQIVRGPNLLAPIIWQYGNNELYNINCNNHQYWYRYIKPCIIKEIKFPQNISGNFEHRRKQNLKNEKSSKNVGDSSSNIVQDKSVIILAQNNISISANSQSLIHFKLNKSIYDQIKGKEVLFEPKVLSKSCPIFFAKQLMLIDSQKIPLLVLNVSNKDFTFKKHAMLGKFHTISENYEFMPYAPPNIAAKVFSMMPGQTLSEDLMKSKIEDIIKSEPWISEIDIGDLTIEQKFKLVTILKEYHIVFSKSRYDIGRTNLLEVNLNVQTDKPIFTKQYPLDREKRQILEKEVQLMKDLDIIEDTVSPFNSPLVIVKKADGSHRVVTDFRKLNKYIPSEVQPLPTLEETLELLGDKKWFSNLDLITAFQQCPLSKESRKYTAATSGMTRFQYKVLPYGLKNNSSAFQGMMNLLLGSMQFRNAIIYIDDVLILSKSFEQHLDSLIELFEKLKSANLKLKPKKCSLVKDRVNFLGHIIMRDGIIPCERKIKAILDIKPPRNAKEIKSFLGLASYFRRFVPDFSSLAAPLNNLTKPSIQFKWTALENESFNTLKSLLINPPILVHPNMQKPFIVTADASTYGIGGILSQLDEQNNERAIAFMSKKLTPAQSRYSATELELLACVEAVEHFRPYLMGSKFKLVTDHRPILYLQNMDNPTSRHFRHILKLMEYDFSVEHRQGVLNGGADCLSRNPQFLDSLHKLKNQNINYMKNLLVKPEQVEDWKINICQELKLNFKSVEKLEITKYENFHSDSFYQQVAKVLCNDVSQSEVIRNVVFSLAQRNKKYWDKSGLLQNVDCGDHLKGIKNGEPATIIDIKTLASVLKIPIILIVDGREEIIFGSLESSTTAFPPLGAVLCFNKDEFQNWVWCNMNLHLPKLNFDTLNSRSKNAKNPVRKDRENGDRIVTKPQERITQSIMQVNTGYGSKADKCKQAQHNLAHRLSDTTHLRVYAVRKVSDVKPNSLYIPTAAELLTCQEKDTYCREWLDYLKHGKKPKFKSVFVKKHENSYKINDKGVLIYIPTKGVRRGELPPNLIVAPLNLFKFIMEATHIYLSHIGRDKTMYIVSQYYHRPGLKRLIARFVNNCALCENKKANKKLRPAEIQPVAPVNDRLTTLSVDCVGPLPLTARRNQYIVSVIDHFSRWVELVAVNNIKTKTIIDKVLMDVIARFGCPERLHSDRAQNFQSSLIKQLCKTLNIHRTMTSGLRPQCNGILEILHKFLGNCLKLMVKNDQKNWDLLIPHVLLAYRTTNHTSLSENPAYVLYGKDLRLPTQLLPTRNDNIDNLDPKHKGNEVAIKFAEAKRTYQEVMEKQTTKSRTIANKNKTTRQINVGDTVLMRKPLNKAKLSQKLHKQFVGEYRVLEKFGKVNYIIQEKNGSKKFTVHIDRIIRQDPQFQNETMHWADEVKDILNQKPQESDDESGDDYDINALWVEDDHNANDLLLPCSLDEYINRQYE